ncbi:hypothetical protein ABZP36_035414 [Zizania latifolia]
MEELFMQVFERRDWVAAQMRQQVDSYDQSLACALLAAGHRPPQWLLPSRPGGGSQELNGRPVLSEFVFPGSRITTPAINRTIFQPPAVPSTSFRNVGIPSGYTHLGTTCASVDTNQQQEVQRKHTSVNEEFAETSAGANMFSMIQRSRSRQKNIKDRLLEKGHAANGGSSRGLQDRMEKSKLANVGLNKIIASLSSEPCGGSANNTGTATLFLGQENDLYDNKMDSTEVLKCSKEGGLGNGVHLDCSPSPVLENQIVSSDNNAMVPNDCSARDLPRTHVADSVCHPLPHTHLFVEPKILQFEGVESVCMSFSGEKMRQPLECASESVHPDLAETHTLNEDPSSTGCYHIPLSVGSSSLDGVESGYLYLDSATVKPHPQCGSLDITSMHSQNEDPSPTLSSELPNSMRRPLLEKDTHCIPETDSLEGPCSKVSQLLEKENIISLETNCSERPCSVGNLLIEMDTLHSIENAEKIRKLDNLSLSAKLTSQNSKPLEQQSSDSHVLPPPQSGSLQLTTQLAGSSYWLPPSPGTLSEILMEQDGCDHLFHPVINDTNNQCSPYRSAVSPDLLPPQIVNSGDVYQSGLSCYESQNNSNRSNGCAVEDASISTEKELSQEQYLLDRPPLEHDENFADEDTPFGHTLHTHNETLKGERAADSVNCYSGRLVDAQEKSRDLSKAYDFSFRNRKNETMMQNFASSISTGVVHRTERSSGTSACTGSLQQNGKDQETSPFDNAVQINANPCTTENNKQMKSSRPSVRYSLRSLKSREKINLLQSEGRSVANDKKRSAADGDQLNGGLSSKRRRLKCQSDTALSSSPHKNSLSSNHQIGIDDHVITVANLSGKSQPSGRYFLRGSGSSECMPLKSETRNAANLCKISVTSLDNKNRNSYPKRRIVVSFDNENGNSQAQLQNILDAASTTSALPSCYGTLIDNKESCTEEENPCLEDQGPNDTDLSVPHQQTALHMDNVTAQSVILDSENYSRANSITMSPSWHSDRHGDQAYAPNALVHENISYDSSADLDRKHKSNGSKGCLLSGAAITRQEGDESVDCADTMPEFERFDAPIQFDSPSVMTRTINALRESRKLVTLSSNFSKKYDTSTASDVHQLLSTIFDKPTKCSFPDDLQQYNANNDRSMTDIFGACGLGLDNSFSIYDVMASCSSNANNRQENTDNPLTPSVEKYSLEKLSARSGSSSEQMGSIPELACFRIDEDSSIGEENEYQGRLPRSVGMNYSHQLPSGRKELQDITGLCQNTGSIGLACGSKLDHHITLINDHGSDKPKENLASSAKREGKVSHSLNTRLSRTELQNRNGRYQSEANIDKQSKPSNIVANVASFIPLVKPKLQPTTAYMKKDVRVKALEAAEAAKRLEEKKQNEREVRKAAAKLERERLKQEKELKQKQEQEQKKKCDADVTAKKRHRGKEERKENERKRKCTEEARKQQKQPTEKRHAVNDENHICQKASDNKEMRNNLTEAVKVQVKPDDETTEPVLAYKATKSNNEKGVAVNERPVSFGSQAMTNIPNSLEESYTMSPYKDSDEEDDDDFEHEEESRRRRKFIPSWARKENLDKTLLSNQTSDPREIFAQKCSFNLSDVLLAHIPQRGFR